MLMLSLSRKAKRLRWISVKPRVITVTKRMITPIDVSTNSQKTSVHFGDFCIGDYS